MQSSKHKSLDVTFHKFSVLANISIFKEKKAKIKPQCTTPIYVLSMCKRKIKSVEELRRYRRTNSWILQVHIRIFYIFFKEFSFLQFSRKIKINPALHSSNIFSFYIQKENQIRWGVTGMQAVQTHKYCKSIWEILHFFKEFSFLQFSKKKKN